MSLTKRVNGVRVNMSIKEEADIRAEWAENDILKAEEEAANGWERARIAGYKNMGSITDQIDIIQKQLQSMANLGEVTLTDETYDWLNDIENIKTRNPKPR